jgi:hypothetical protein
MAVHRSAGGNHTRHTVPGSLRVVSEPEWHIGCPAKESSPRGRQRRHPESVIGRKSCDQTRVEHRYQEKELKGGKQNGLAVHSSSGDSCTDHPVPSSVYLVHESRRSRPSVTGSAN